MLTADTMAQTTKLRRRFVPIPVETTFVHYTKGGPTAELTPEPSPRSASPSPPPQPEQKQKRRFAPQLIESTRRSRKAGDVGPATKPTDKTDITPYTKHIYAPKSRRKSQKVPSLARRESCDDEIAGHVFDLIARDAERRLQEVALSAFPNSGVRVGGAEHFYVREGSDDDSSRSRGRSTSRARGPRQSRRDSSEEDVGWAVREMQEHHDQLSKFRGEERISTLDLDKMSIDSPPGDPFWTTSRKASGDSMRPIGESPMPFLPSQPLPTIGETATTTYVPSSSPPIRPIGESLMPYVPPAPSGNSCQIPPETGFRSRGAFGAPYSGHKNRDLAADRELHKLKRQAPPMLGKDLTFRKCPSPQQTKLEPDHPWTAQGIEETHRDKTGQHGLWQGYCYSPEMKEAIVPIERPAMVETPYPPASPGDPFAAVFRTAPVTLSEEPSRMATGSLSVNASTSEHRSKHGDPRGLHMLVGLEERLRKEKAAADLEEKIAAEFTDTFITQVYNYLSLGYPAMARSYDEELSKISHIPMDELGREDDAIMDGIGSAKGHIMLEMKDQDEDDRCPRWKALKKYIFEWARQHPNLDSISPLAWGVRERRGSWGI